MDTVSPVITSRHRTRANKLLLPPDIISDGHGCNDVHVAVPRHLADRPGPAHSCAPPRRRRRRAGGDDVPRRCVISHVSIVVQLLEQQRQQQLQKSETVVVVDDDDDVRAQSRFGSVDDEGNRSHWRHRSSRVARPRQLRGYVSSPLVVVVQETEKKKRRVCATKLNKNARQP